MTSSNKITVRVGQILKETMWIRDREEPFISYTRIDAINQGVGNEVLICGPGAIRRNGTPMHLEIFGTPGPDGSAQVDLTFIDEWENETKRETIQDDQLPEGYIWSDEIRPDYAGLGPERKR